MKDAKKDAIRAARKIVASVPVYLDTETTGLGSDAQVIDIALIDTDGTELINTLVRPTIPISIEATRIHGITNEDVATAATFGQILPNLNSYNDRLIVIYNKSYDLRLCNQSAKANKIEPWAPPETICAMELYAEFYGDWNDYHESYRWQKQSDAARQLGIEIPADLHRGAADANLCRLIIEAMAATPLPGEARKQCNICRDPIGHPNNICDDCQELRRRILAKPIAAKLIISIDIFDIPIF
ncbi:MAG: 3'-5' exonuclease [Planctomycetota bacterium]|jgi:DNA polymerase-3 subunit epsilon